MAVLIDSHGWIEYFIGDPLASKYAKFVEAASVSECVVPAIVLYEVYNPHIESHTLQRGDESMAG